MSYILLEIGLLILLLVANGVFAMAEMAVISSRRSRLQAMGEEGNRGAMTALSLVASPGQFLSTIQVGITLVGTMAGASSGAALIGELAPVLARVPWLESWAIPLATLFVVGGITFLTVVIGELVPKRIAIQSPETTASRLSPLMAMLSRAGAPAVRLLDATSGFIARLLGARTGSEPGVTEEDVRAMIHQGTLSGVFKASEQRMVERVLELDDLVAADVMTPKNQIIWINLDDAEDISIQHIASSGHTHFPAYRRTRDNVLGMLSVKTVWTARQQNPDASIESLIVEPLFVPDSMPCPRIIEEFKKQRRHIALVIDEFGGVAGLVTLHDMMEAVLGSMPDQDQRDLPQIRQQSDGSWLIDALADIEEVAAATGLSIPPRELDTAGYRSLSGFILHHMGHLPKEGETFDYGQHRLEITDTDRQRIDKVTIRRMA